MKKLRVSFLPSLFPSLITSDVFLFPDPFGEPISKQWRSTDSFNIGYDKNDLVSRSLFVYPTSCSWAFQNLDHFTHNIIRKTRLPWHPCSQPVLNLLFLPGTELRAITSTAAPDPALWAFSPENNLVFASNIDNDERITPEEWLERGRPRMQQALTVVWCSLVEIHWQLSAAVTGSVRPDCPPTHYFGL